VRQEQAIRGGLCYGGAVRANTIAVLAFHGIGPLHLAVPCSVFGEDRRDAGVPRFKVLVCALEKTPLRTSAGFSVETRCSLAALRKAGTIIVPGWHRPYVVPPEPLLEALRRAHARGVQLVGLCLGSFVLAAAGLLDGRPATTHWAAMEEFTKRFPRVHVDPNVLYIDDGDVLTSAGGTAAIDCCLHLLRKMCGAEIAHRVARRLVVPPHRQGSQAQFVEPQVREAVQSDRMSQLLDWVVQHLDQTHSLDTLARRALMSRRTFTRHFRQATGTTVGKWLVAQRLAFAQRLLETTDQAIEVVAGEAGFGSAVSLRQHFLSAFHTSPSLYRREFRYGDRQETRA
jgi:transcriptional regulator GlxA family with amidase domain